MLSHFLHSLGNYTRRAIFPDMGKINQSSVDFHGLIDWLAVSQLWLGWFSGVVPPDLFYGGGAKVTQHKGITQYSFCNTPTRRIAPAVPANFSTAPASSGPQIAVPEGIRWTSANKEEKRASSKAKSETRILTEFSKKREWKITPEWRVPAAVECRWCRRHFRTFSRPNLFGFPRWMGHRAGHCDVRRVHPRWTASSPIGPWTEPYSGASPSPGRPWRVLVDSDRPSNLPGRTGSKTP